jgi:F-type H+-transporting ATPase subunit b
VRSAFDLPVEQRAAIQDALNKTFSAEIRVRFETAPDLVSGIELTTNGQKVAWSIAGYLASLEKGVEDLLKERDKPEAKAKTSSDLTPQIAKRAYELYEQRGRKNDSAIQDWSQAEREIQKVEAKAEPKPAAKAAPKPAAKTESEPAAKAAPEPEAEAAPKPAAKTEPEPAAKAEPEPEAEAAPRADVPAEPKPEESKPATKGP